MNRRRAGRVSIVVAALMAGPVAVQVISGGGWRNSLAPHALEAAVLDGAVLATAYLTWRTYRVDRPDRSVPDLRSLADQLAGLVRRQWEGEASRLNNPGPLPVRWTAADTSLCDDWAMLVKLATSGAGWPPPRSDSIWARSPGQLAGRDRDLRKIFGRIPTGRLVVLGEPGAGKTMLMVRLVLDLVAERADGDPVPALVSLASWDPGNQGLHDWLAGQLNSDLDLVDVGASGATGPTLIRALLADRLIMPVLDGLDEIPDELRPMAISRINAAIRPGERLVVTCRTDQYRDALRPVNGLGVTLRGAAAVTLCPLDSEQDTEAVAGYLQHDAGGLDARRRWAPVIAQLGPRSALGLALTTPLMIGLAREIYNPRPGSSTGGLRDPAELRSPSLTDHQAVEQHLFDAFIPAAYRPGPGGPGFHDRRQAARAERWLEFLARYLEASARGADFAWWELPNAVKPRVPGLLTGAAAGLGTAIAVILGTSAHGAGTALAAGIGAGLASGAGTAIAIGITIARRQRRHSGRAASIIPGVAAGIGAGLSTAAAFGMSTAIQHGLTAGINAALQPALTYGIANGIVIGLVTAGRQLPSPSRRLRWRFSYGKLAAAIAVGTAAGILIGLPGGSINGVAAALRGGLAVTLAVGLATGLAGTPRDPAHAAASPRTVLRRDRGTALFIILSSGTGVGVLFALGHSLAIGIGVGLATGLAFGFTVSIPKAAWPAYEITRSWLALRHCLPWNLMTFLEDAHDRGVLRRAGTVYQFRHAGLQHRLATRYRPDEP